MKVKMDKRIIIYDTTLRDGTQGGAVSLSVEDKIGIAQGLDNLRFDYIEGGWPGSNPKDVEFFQRAQGIDWNYAKIVAFGSTRRKDVKPSKDENLRLLLEAKTPVITIFGKSDVLHVKDALATTFDENLRMIYDSVAYLKEYSRREVVYDAEHFFDGFRRNPEYAIKTLLQAKKAGADFLVLCDTNGGNGFYDIEKTIREVRKEFPSTRLGIHAHNDIELAVANSLAAVQEGVEMVQGTVNGFGERSGNANLISIIPNLAKNGYETKGEIPLNQLRYLSRYVYEIANLQPNPRQSFVGDFAFAHKGGVHVAAVSKNPELYEHITPETVGNKRHFLTSDLAGTAHIAALKEHKIDKKDPLAKRILKEIKKREHLGFEYEAANASLDLLVRRFKGEATRIFELRGYNVEIKKDANGDTKSYANIKIKVNGEEFPSMDSGNGPVNALDRALRKALTSKYPELEDLVLEDYKVRVISGATKGTASSVRVLIESSFRGDRFGTVGVDENSVDASWQALVDSYEFAHLRSRIGNFFLQ